MAKFKKKEVRRGGGKKGRKRSKRFQKQGCWAGQAAVATAAASKEPATVVAAADGQPRPSTFSQLTLGCCCISLDLLWPWCAVCRLQLSH